MGLPASGVPGAAVVGRGQLLAGGSMISCHLRVFSGVSPSDCSPPPGRLIYLKRHKLGIISVGDLCSLQNLVYIAQNLLVGFPGGSEAKNPPAVQEMWVRSQGQEDPLEEDMVTPSSNSLWKIPWTEEPG